MSDIKTRVQGIDPNIRARDIKSLAETTSSIYETLAVITKRAEQISMDIKEELHGKLEEFASTSDTIEEILENKEQIEISKFYERLPNPIIIATEEFVNNDLTFEYKERERVIEE
ncbi:MAG: DNA-directed RNA polymerase subunit omega [Saprospiraceae bacterium]|nr:DNA-directed RNA polymerase subunit omega [Saprospiraceae bacterium]MBK6566238.1 DNA-directed RNA polymerase subunit omega [Saprospiraceae bacterium]MBK6783232.1 DNA-directed RNA polymerase subunit omega [Saprospiraceae bacterium]MBK8080565.1 DNA-directed RNA polymerase subunit omega [Saprospiraceae bacterium]MBK8372919.1 DNA-directed RNA polymerase subunit omega [Saprospiraceae bacterium]